MRVSEAVHSRRSMRVFKPDPVAKADIEWIIETANRSASNGNLQPWKLYVTMGAARKRLSAAILSAMDAGDNGPGAEYNVYPQEMTPVYDARRKLVGKQLYTLLGVPRGDAAGMMKQFRKNYEFFDAPVGMILCVEKRMGNGQWIDCGIFLDQLMLLAREKGLHTCPQAAFSRYQHVVRRELKIPDDQTVICGLALGYADPDVVPNSLITDRAPIQDFTTWFSE
ncbi:nitroreductase [Reyranella sp.]|jgi:nitroreductase|uniref:nitroreductase n=1 Tax=Reyranella sp. TaxID=1929291 RepID=UPI003BACF1BE